MRFSASRRRTTFTIELGCSSSVEVAAPVDRDGLAQDAVQPLHLLPVQHVAVRRGALRSIQAMPGKPAAAAAAVAAAPDRRPGDVGAAGQLVLGHGKMPSPSAMKCPPNATWPWSVLRENRGKWGKGSALRTLRKRPGGHWGRGGGPQAGTRPATLESPASPRGTSGDSSLPGPRGTPAARAAPRKSSPAPKVSLMHLEKRKPRVPSVSPGGGRPF